MEVILHDEEDVLSGGETTVLALPLLPALRTQLGEVVNQALQFLGRGLGYALALLQLAEHLRANQQCSRYALHAALQFLLQPSHLLSVLLSAVFLLLNLRAQFADTPGILVQSET